MSCHCRLLLQHDLMELSVRRLNNSLSTNKERLHAHSQIHTQTPKEEKKQSKKTKKTKKTKQTNPKPHNGDGLSKLPLLLALSVSLSLLNTSSRTRRHTGKKKKKIEKLKHICPKRFWQELRQARDEHGSAPSTYREIGS